MVPTVKELGARKGPKTHVFCNNLCVNVWISLTLYDKDPYHKGKAVIEFGCIWPKHAGERGKKGAKNLHFSGF